PIELVPVFNDFVRTVRADNLRFKRVDLFTYKAIDSLPGLLLRVQLSEDLTEREAQMLFGDYLDRWHPRVEIAYAWREENELDIILQQTGIRRAYDDGNIVLDEMNEE